jgi:hypothetical protein
LLANVAYVLTASDALGDVATPIAASAFGPLIAGASVALYLLLSSERATLAGLLAAVGTCPVPCHRHYRAPLTDLA